MREAFVPKRFNADSLALIDRMNQIMEAYSRQGYDLSLRQLYYQLVSRNVVPNTEQSYKRVGSILSDARLAGLSDWALIVDRGRECVRNNHWDSPAQIVRACARQFQFDKWEDQPFHVEVMVEKQALEGVLEPVCRRLDVPFTANKGYSSSSAMYEAGKRLADVLVTGRRVVVLYLGDHDPSGIDMTRDVRDRLALFSGAGEWDEADQRVVCADEEAFQVIRVALNRSQIDLYDPPPNPAKLTDSRATGYIREYGYESWELDALEPSVLADLVEAEVLRFRDEDLWEAAIAREKGARDLLGALAQQAEGGGDAS